jgi:hypothetical protein
MSMPENVGKGERVIEREKLKTAIRVGREPCDQLMSPWQRRAAHKRVSGIGRGRAQVPSREFPCRCRGQLLGIWLRLATCQAHCSSIHMAGRGGWEYGEAKGRFGWPRAGALQLTSPSVVREMGADHDLRSVWK